MLGSFLLFVSVAVPTAYTLRTRLNTVPRLGGFFVIYFLPVLPWLASWTGLGSVISVYLLYEIGYMQNDAIAVRAESHPTHRAPAQLVATIESYFPGIIFIRLILLAMITAFLCRGQSICFSIGLLSAYCLLLLVFCLHNSLPSPRRMPTFFALNFLRYAILYFTLLSSASTSFSAFGWLGLLVVSAIHPVFSVFQKYFSLRAAQLASFVAFFVALFCLLPLMESGYLFALPVPLLLLTATSLAIRSACAAIRPS